MSSTATPPRSPWPGPRPGPARHGAGCRRRTRRSRPPGDPARRRRPRTRARHPAVVGAEHGRGGHPGPHPDALPSIRPSQRPAPVRRGARHQLVGQLDHGRVHTQRPQRGRLQAEQPAADDHAPAGTSGPRSGWRRRRRACGRRRRRPGRCRAPAAERACCRWRAPGGRTAGRRPRWCRPCAPPCPATRPLAQQQRMPWAAWKPAAPSRRAAGSSPSSARVGGHGRRRRGAPPPAPRSRGWCGGRARRPPPGSGGRPSVAGHDDSGAAHDTTRSSASCSRARSWPRLCGPGVAPRVRGGERATRSPHPAPAGR